MSKFLYHWVPNNMVGTVLYPLNQLKDTMPEVYAEHVKKYDNRPKLLKRNIPILNCLWNDVLHLTAVHPDKIAEAMSKAGIQTKSWNHYEVPVENVLGSNAVAFLYKEPLTIDTEDKFYEVFDPEHMDQYDVIPDATIDYYKQCAGEGKKPLVFHLVPHILYRGSIDTKDLKIIESKKDWSTYYEKTGRKDPAPFAVSAIEYVTNFDKAIDLGAGSLRDTKFFADKGFKKVIAYDSSSSMPNNMSSEYESKIFLDNRSFEVFDYPIDTFDFVYSKVSLQFVKPDKFVSIFKTILNSVKKEGVIALSMLGPKDDWAKNTSMTFVDPDVIKNLFSDWEIIEPPSP